MRDNSWEYGHPEGCHLQVSRPRISKSTHGNTSAGPSWAPVCAFPQRTLSHCHPDRTPGPIGSCQDAGVTRLEGNRMRKSTFEKRCVQILFCDKGRNVGVLSKHTLGLCCASKEWDFALRTFYLRSFTTSVTSESPRGLVRVGPEKQNK